MMSENIGALIAKLESAEGPSRELDLQISFLAGKLAAADDYGAGPIASVKWSVMGDEIDTLDAEGRRGCLDPAQFVPAYTASIDAALTLVPSGHWWRVEHDDDGETKATAWCGPIGEDRDRCDSATPALALCIAALRARMA